MPQCPTDAIRIGVNHHAIKYYPADYITRMDKVAHKWIRARSQAPIISAFPDDELPVKLPYHMVNSGILAIWAAHQMGARTIYCCGMDFYRNPTDYVDGSSPVRPQNKTRQYGERCRRVIRRLEADGANIVRFSWW